ncbi:hypothetical protein HNR48_003351 [Pseudoteredinibacter isoporae]|uniref:Uncharacterized protein n=1 Tax=Pseudoteredinibacter isoporae TaxID=570281 RepID=A0A7X0JWD5_9GAMM|nr:hypothetical protein [Pseudoteredinibacter isoporae]
MPTELYQDDDSLTDSLLGRDDEVNHEKIST